MEAAHAVKVPVIADGGIRYTGWYGKSISGRGKARWWWKCVCRNWRKSGETIIYEGRKFKQYRGMGSIGAMQKRGSSDRYFRDVEDELRNWCLKELKDVWYSKEMWKIVHQYTGGLHCRHGLLQCQKYQGTATSEICQNHQCRDEREPCGTWHWKSPKVRIIQDL